MLGYHYINIAVDEMTNYVALAVNLNNNILYMYKFLRCVNFEDATIQHFCDYIFEDHQPFENSQIS